jgi:hypothetical protein
MLSDSRPQPGPGPVLPAIGFGALLYRFMFFDWLFTDLSQKMTLLERHAAWQHNRAMCRYLPLYLRRWAVLSGVDFAAGMLFERLLEGGVLAAWFYMWSCVALTAMALMSVLWLFLSNPDRR